MNDETAVEHPYWFRRMRRMLRTERQVALVLTTKGVKAKLTMYAESKGDVELLIGVYSSDVCDAQIMEDVESAKREARRPVHYVRKAA